MTCLMGSLKLFLALVAAVFPDYIFSAGIYSYVPTTISVPPEEDEASHFIPAVPLSNARFPWYQVPYSAVQLSNPQPTADTLSNAETRTIQITKIVQEPSVVTTTTSLFLGAPAASNLSADSPPPVASSPRATNRTARLSSGGRSKKATLNPTKVPHVTYASANTVFHIPGPPRYTLKPPPHAPPPTSRNGAVNPPPMSLNRNTTKTTSQLSLGEGSQAATIITTNVPHITYTPTKTVFYIPDPPRYALKPPPHAPPPTSSNGAVNPPPMTLNRNTTKTTSQLSLGEGSQAATIITTNISHITYTPTKTVFYIPDPPRYALKPAPHAPPPTSRNGAVNPPPMTLNQNTTKTTSQLSLGEGSKATTIITSNIPHITYTPTKTVLYIPDTPRYALKAPPHVPPPAFRNTVEGTRKSEKHTYHTQKVLLATSPSVFHIGSPSDIPTLSPPSTKLSLKIVKYPANNMHDAHSVIISPSPALLQIAAPPPVSFSQALSPDTTITPTAKATSIPHSSVQPPAAVVLNAPTIVNVVVPTPTMTTTAPSKPSTLPPKQVFQHSIPSPRVVAPTAPTVLAKSPAAQPFMALVTSRPTTVRPAKQVAKKQISQRLPFTAIRVTRPPSVHQAPLLTAKGNGSSSIQNFTQTTVTNSTMIVSYNGTSHGHNRYTVPTKLLPTTRAPTSHKTPTRASVAAGSKIHYSQIKKKIAQGVLRVTQHAPSVKTSLSAGAQVKVAKSAVSTQPPPVISKFPPGNKTISPTVTVAKSSTVVGAVPTALTKNTEALEIVKTKSSAKPTAPPTPGSKWPTAALGVHKHHVVVGKTSTSTVTELKKPGVFKLAAALASSAAAKAMKQAGPIIGKPQDPLVGGSGTMIARNLTSQLNTFQRP
ncbi:uncharacterized protein LOC142576115 [Dermacentor variabilis]|uniref:uncharacterized protein LOC142576115 n=1 Tax=Dermacentor variabilis TaxID=34621 RepID=UPI003F5B214D